MKFEKRKLQNGLTIIEAPSSEADSVVVDIFVKTGSRSETPKENGISHFLEHFLFKGTKTYPSALAITELIDGIGGEMNANTGKEHTQYFIKSHSDNLELIFKVLTSMLQEPLFDADELKREKGVIVEELNMYKDMPMAEIENVLENAVWKNQPIGRDIVGSKNTVTKFTPLMFRDYMHRHYQPGNMIIGVSGKYDSKKFNDLIKQYWEPLKNKKFHLWDKAMFSGKGPKLEVKFKQTEQAHVVLGFKGLNYASPKNPAASVVSSILGGGMSSRMFIQIRERRGLAYYVRSRSEHLQDTGLFTIGMGVKVANIEEALRAAIDEINKIKTELVSEKELQKAKSYLKGRTTLSLEDNQARLDWCIDQEAFKKEISTPEQVFAKIDKVTSKDVQKIARQIFDPKFLTVAVIGPYKNSANLKKALTNLK